MSVDRMVHDLKWFYRHERARGVKHSVELRNATPGMFGTQNAQSFGLKAGEANHFLPFLRWLIHRYSAKLPTVPLLLQGCDSLVRVQELTKQYPAVFPAPAIQEFHNECYRHLRICELLDIPVKPKHHAFMHAAQRLYHGCLRIAPTFSFCLSFFSLWFVLLLCVCVRLILCLGSLLTGLGFKDVITSLKLSGRGVYQASRTHAQTKTANHLPG